MLNGYTSHFLRKSFLDTKAAGVKNITVQVACGDGMSDGWELAHGSNPNFNDASGDADGDGASNWQEFIAGTNPQDASDALRLLPLSADLAGGNLAVRLQFPARSNKTYTVSYRATLGSEPWITLTHVLTAPTNRLLTITDFLPANAGARFYRLASPRLP